MVLRFRNKMHVTNNDLASNHNGLMENKSFDILSTGDNARSGASAADVMGLT